MRANHSDHREIDVGLNATNGLATLLADSDKDNYPVLCIRFTSSSILRLPALCSGSDKPTPRSWEGVAGIGRVGTGTRVEDVGDESVETNELSEEVDIGLIKWSRLRIGEFCLRASLNPPPLYVVGDRNPPANSVGRDAVKAI